MRNLPSLIVAIVLATGTLEGAQPLCVGVHVTDFDDNPLSGIQLGPQGPGTPGVTDTGGYACLVFAQPISVRQDVYIQLIQSPRAVPQLAILSPHDRKIPVSPPGEAADVIVVTKQSADLLKGEYTQAMYLKMVADELCRIRRITDKKLQAQERKALGQRYHASVDRLENSVAKIVNFTCAKP